MKYLTIPVITNDTGVLKRSNVILSLKMASQFSLMECCYDIYDGIYSHRVVFNDDKGRVTVFTEESPEDFMKKLSEFVGE